jgi:hypothetical protein
MTTSSTPPTTSTQVELGCIDPDDTVILPGDPVPRHVLRTWVEGRYLKIQVAEGPFDVYSFDTTSDRRKATLIERPGYGPFNEVYEIGDLVYFRFGNWNNKLGVVIGYDENPEDPTDRAYEIRCAISTGYAGPDSMRRADQPKLAVGQRWHCTTNGQYGVVIEVDDIGLTCELRLEDTGTVGRFVLAAPFWEIVNAA